MRLRLSVLTFYAVTITLVVAGVVVAIAPLVLTALLALSSGPLLHLPIPGYTLSNYEEVIDYPGYVRSIVTSLVLAFAVVIVSAVIGTATALGLRNSTGKPGALMWALILSPIVFPSLAFGLALFEITVVLDVSSGVKAIFVGHVILAVPFVARTVAAGLDHLPPEMEKAARTLGAHGWYLARRITLPLVKASIFSASVFAFWISFDNFTISYFLASPEERPVPIQLLIMASTVVDPSLAAGATLLLVVSVPVILAVRPIFSVRRIREMW